MFVRFLEETSAWRNRFDFVWPLIMWKKVEDMPNFGGRLRISELDCNRSESTGLILVNLTSVYCRANFLKSQYREVISTEYILHNFLFMMDLNKTFFIRKYIWKKIFLHIYGVIHTYDLSVQDSLFKSWDTQWKNLKRSLSALMKVPSLKRIR